MTPTAILHPVAHRVAHKDTQRWTASIVITVGLHVAIAAIFLWHHDEAELRHPPPALPAVTMIDLQPLPPPPVPAVIPPPPVPPPPEVQAQPQPQPQPQPIAKPVMPPRPKPVMPHRVTPTPTPPSPVVEPVQESMPQAAASASAATTGPAAPSPPVASHAVPHYGDLVAAQIERYKRYPASALKRGEHGVATVHFMIDRHGQVSNARIEGSSGHADLDEEALAAVQRAAPFPAFTVDVTGDTADIVEHIGFAIH